MVLQECASLPVEEHTACSCGCGLDPAACPPTSHTYSAGRCACECRDREARARCEEAGGRWGERDCSCHLSTPPPPSSTTPALPTEDSRPSVAAWVTRELVVLALLLLTNLCLATIVASLCGRLRAVQRKVDERAGRREGQYYQVETKVEREEELKSPKLVNNTYSEIDIYSASSGFGSERGSPVYGEIQQNVRLKNYEKFENSQVAMDRNRASYARAIQSIDETIKMLQESAEKL